MSQTRDQLLALPEKNITVMTNGLFFGFIGIYVIFTFIAFCIADGMHSDKYRKLYETIQIIEENNFLLNTEIENLENKLNEFMINKKDTIFVDFKLQQAPTHIHIKQQ